MRTRVKKAAAIFLTVLLVCGVSVGLTGCDQLKDRYTEDFVYRRMNGYIAIMGLTDIGKTKEILVMPEKIDKTDVTCFYFDAYGIHSDNLKKIFIPGIEPSTWHQGDDINGARGLKIINYRSNVVWYTSSSTARAYISRSFYDWRPQAYNYNDEHFANVSFMYNYEGKTGGRYWIDAYDYGERITYIPKDPTRKEYIFNGWYKEPACIHKWDFDEDTLPEEKVVDGVVQYQETRLYAKWL